MAGDAGGTAAPAAVYARGIVKSYGGRRSKVEVLKHLDLTLPTGQIYGLLGPSGCGKTSLLKCIVGRLTPDSGTLRVMGRAPNSVGHQVPGTLVGYMPQEIALYPEFTVRETLYFFSLLLRMPRARYLERMAFLLQLLDISNLKDRLIGNLSGGQKRRVSFAAALLDQPPLLILDEPTVGVDPLLRARLWAYLQELTAPGSRTSVLITTHYIDEAAQAHMVGMMRHGRLLAEEPPQQLMRRFSAVTLEDVFLHLCRGTSLNGHKGIADDDSEEAEAAAQQQQQHVRDALALPANSINSPASAATATVVVKRDGHYSDDDGDGERPTNTKSRRGRHAEAEPLLGTTTTTKDVVVPKKQKLRRGPGVPRFHVVMALVWKGLKRLSRNYGVLLFQLLLPALQVILFCVAIGRTPEHLPMGVVNLDTPTYIPLLGNVSLADWYLEELDSRYIHQINYASTASAVHAVHQGQAWGYYGFGANYTICLMDRFKANVSIATISCSEIELAMDNSNEQISIIIGEESALAYSSFLHKVAQKAGINTHVVDSPIRFEKPIYGSERASFTDFVAPGVMTTITFGQAIGLTALSFVMDAKEGLLDRCWAAGARPSEVILAHVINQFFVVMVQIGSLLIFALAVFDLPMVGSLALVILLMLLLGLSGMTYGLFISTRTKEETGAIQLALGSFFPILLLSGVLWPVEAIPLGLRYISYAMPTTWAVDAMRSIMLRGWGLEHQPVYLGFVLVVSWSLLFILFSALGIRSVD